MTFIIKCDECSHETNADEYCTSSCSECKKYFCCGITKSCFTKFHRKSNCKGICMTITNPKWIMNLREILKNDT